jgi:hypothetical protein
MKTLTLQIADELYDVFERTAAEEGRTLEEVAIEWLAQNRGKSRPSLTPEQRRATRELLRCHMGAVASGDPHSADNERIDADLAREYGSTHEED